MNRRRNLGNALFLIQRAYKLDPRSIIVKLPLSFLQAVMIFIPLLFLRWILNAVQQKQQLSYIIYLTCLFAIITLVSNLLKEWFVRLNNKQADTISSIIKKDISQRVVHLPYWEVENPKTRDFIQMVQSSADLPGLLENIFQIFSQILTLGGLVTIILSLQPALILLILAVLFVRSLIKRWSRGLWDKWREPINTSMRKINYLMYVMNAIEYGKEIRSNSLQEWFYQKLTYAIKDYIDKMNAYNQSLQRRNAFIELALIIQEAVVYVFLAYRVIFHGLLIGDFSMYLSGN